MRIEYKGKVTNLDDKDCSKMKYEDFEAMCLEMSTFKLMQPKERIPKIKECYGRINRVSKESGKDQHNDNVRSDNKGAGAGNSTAKQGSVIGRQEHQEPKDKAEIQKPSIRKEKSKTKL